MRSGILGLFLLWFAMPSFAQTPKISQLKEQLDHAKTYSAKVEVIVKLAEKLKQSGNIQQSLTLLGNAEKIADSLKSSHLIQLVQIQFADDYMDNDQPDSTIKIMNGMLAKYPQSKQKAKFLSMLGSAFRIEGKYQDALSKQEAAKALIDSTKNPRMFNRIELHLGATYGDMGYFGRAFKYHLKSINGAEALGDSLLLATSLNSLGVVYNEHHEYGKAQFYLKRAIPIENKIGDKIGLLRAYNNLAISLHNQNLFDQAIKLYHKSLTLHNEIRKDVPPFRILYNLGQLYKDTKQLDKAENYYHRSLTYCKQAGIAQGLVYNYGGLANVAELRNNYSKAHEYYTKAQQIAKKIGAQKLQREALRSLYKLEKGRNNFKRALAYHEKYTALNDSLNKKANEEKIEDSETKLSLRKQEEINRLLKDKQREQGARLTFKNWLIAAGIGIIIIVLISIILLYRANKGKQKINSELQAQRNKLEELNKVKDKILAIIAHDLRSPLASMQGMVYLFREEELSKEEINEMTAELEVSISQNISMMDNLLVWAREQMSGMALNIETIDAYKVVKEVFENFQFQAEHKGIKLINKVAPDLKVKADDNLIKLILRNLVSNSIKFCKNGDQLTISTIEETGKIIFEVADTGIGIPEAKKNTLFTVKSGSRSGTNDEKGSGLGLQLCKEFVEKQEGEISVKSTEGVGTTFIFSLPRAS
ncbi:MAG TPA: tetratricopeptide repeat-containing sensor histidine kinase [Balneolaceae bacterium]|nr:tetratricopeptide repeat-containing sensor histidine kinase [Balneolaceae bacterium]